MNGSRRGGQRGQISIDRIVALRSSVLPLYVLIQPNGLVTTSDEVSEDGCDFLTTRMHGDQISFSSIRGDYLSAEGGEVSTRRYCGADERFAVQKLDTQYAFRTRSGKYLSILDRPPFVVLADTAGDTEVFQLFSLMMDGINVGNQLEMLERTGMVTISDLLAEDQLAELRAAVAECGGAGPADGSKTKVHEFRAANLAGSGAGFAGLATHPLVMQLARRVVSPKLKVSDVESCRTDADFVRKELEETTWSVVHPYSSVEYPGLADPRASLTAMWFLDTLDEANSTWAWAQAPLADGMHLPRLPHLSSLEEIEAVASTARPLSARSGSVWLYLGPVWLSNSVGAASFWKDHDAQTRYKHLSGQKEQTFRALADAQRSAPQREELCPTVVQATYVREYVATRFPPVPHGVLAGLGRSTEQRQMLQMLMPPP